MPRLIDSDRRTSEMVTGVVRVLVTDGIPGLTMRRIGEQCGTSPSALLHHFGTREHMLRVAAHRTGRTLISAAEAASLWLGVEAFLPADEDATRLTQAWLAWVELARSQTWLEPTVTELRCREREILRETLGHRGGEPEPELVAALLDGLRQAICAPADPMSLERARELFMSAPGGGVVAHASAPGEARDGEDQDGGDR